MSTFPLYIVCHAAFEPAAYLCTYLDKKNISYKKISGIHDELAALDLDTVSGLVFMGGRYSVNDDLPWLADEIKLIQRAIEKDVPLMGICFGAQLISKALGAEVSKAEHMETGWHAIKADISRLADIHTLDLDDTFEVFEWHEDTFSMPVDAIPIFSGHNLENQGYLYGNTLTMQFHLEMTEYMVNDWLRRYCDCMPKASKSVQCPEEITGNLTERLNNLHAVADKIYDWWLNMAKLY
ncbi:MAG: type 1 glutamine amidotransferase [Gammaproteobacteria bacterium]|nr:type 1 glutamine amidotransferase [Gammaproteobacteria bacterium]